MAPKNLDDSYSSEENENDVEPPQNQTQTDDDDDSSEEEDEPEQPTIVQKPQKSMTSTHAKSASKPRYKPVEASVKIVSSKKPRKEKKEEKEKKEQKQDEGLASVRESGRKEDKEEKESEEGLSKKQAVVPFQRVFSDEDEIVILKGMVDYKQKKGVDAMTDLDDFCGFIKPSLASDYEKRQVADKVRRFRKKFNKGNKKVTTQHDKKILKLCEEIWKKGESVGDEGNVVNGGKSSSEQIGVAVTGVEVGEDVSKKMLKRKGMELMGEKAKRNLAEMWDRVSLAQMEVDQMRFKVLKEEHKKILEALKSAKQ